MDKTHDGDMPQWSPGARFHTWLGSLQLVLGIAYLLEAVISESGARRIVLGVAWMVFGATLLASVVPRRVAATEGGLVIRGAFWRQTFVSWSEVADIRREGERADSLLAIFTSDGSIIRTGLHPVEHRSLPGHWRSVTSTQLD